MKVHICPLNRECRNAGAPARLHVSTKKLHIGIALTPGAMFAGRLEEKPRWFYIVRNPK